jgi:tetratricopeptide (TPR) repeat protein
MNSADPLSDIESGIEALVPEGALMRAIEANAAIGEEAGERGIRFAIARGIVENRNGLHQSALTALQKARTMALEADARGHLARISREIARVYTWRGDARSAALELLRSLVEAEAAGSHADTTAAVAEVGRLNLEVGRYEAAVQMLERAAALAPGVLAAREPARIAVNRCEALLALGRREECLALAEQSIPLIGDEFPREQFTIRALRARCLASDGRDADAAAAADELRAKFPADGHSYRDAEWRLLDGFMKRGSDPDGAIAALQEALARFGDDDLPRHEVEARIQLADLLATHDRLAEAESCIVEALRRCEARQLPAMADRARAAAIRFWRPEKIADLSAGDAVSERTGGDGGRFLIMETLGSGGFGSVQRAIDQNTGDEVAIKTMRAEAIAAGGEDAATIIATVRNEVRAAAQISARRAVAQTRYLHVEPSGAVMLVQDFVRGPTLRRIVEDATVPKARRLAIAARLVRAVAGIHAGNLAHRDLKPENVILRNGADPVLIDLGLATLGGATDTLSGMGTPRYAAPEQWNKVPADPRWFGREDVFALGKILEEMIVDAGEAEAKPAGTFAALKQRFQGKAGLTGKLAKLVQTMMAENPADRDLDLKDVAAALEEAAAEAERGVSPN